ncbi:Rieske-like 2Fe-2S protein [Archangium gephyra]|uniref:Rieske n=1 Tax=Archangium gephyra TaxID=48 RepID=A0AAC8Q2M9_9BACT|nr:Rieske 2Fe-2S domain-containing protein [Archangium gephyra]AKI99853.1 Rieske [Archangium gephyra]REG33433.1 Rieske-like 2Fe-2S protein [Archangium gephyra]
MESLPNAPLPDVTRFFHPVLPARKLKDKPVRVELAGRAYALFRDAQGRPAALADACPHRMAPLSAGRVTREGQLECPYHGWRFDADGRGRSPSQPELKKCDARAFQLVERFGYLWLSARDTPLSAFPDFAPEGYGFNGAFSMLFRAPLHVTLDNFSEDEHTPFVHTRLGWDRSQTKDISYEAHNLEDRTEVRYRAPQRRSFLIPLLLLRNGDFFQNHWVTRFDPVRTDYTLTWTGPAGEQRPFTTRAIIFFVPETAHTTRLHTFSFAQLHDERLRPLMPLVRRVTLVLSWFEIRDDARFIPLVAHTPYSLKGMRLGKYDKPLIHHRKLLERLYFAQGEASSPPTPLPLPEAANG